MAIKGHDKFTSLNCLVIMTSCGGKKWVGLRETNIAIEIKVRSLGVVFESNNPTSLHASTYVCMYRAVSDR